MPVQTYQADWVFPVDQPPIPRGVLSVEEGLIVAIEPDRGQVVDRYYPQSAIVPGLVNAHVHLDLSTLKETCSFSGSFTGWLKNVIAHRRQVSEPQVRQAIREGMRECLRSGTTLLGDIRSAGWIDMVLEEPSPRVVVFHELIGLQAAQLEAVIGQAQAFIWKARPSAMFRIGLSPHAPYSVHRDLFAWAGQMGLPLSVHLAEHPDELELMERHAGSFRALLEELGAWEPNGMVASWQDVATIMNATGPVVFAHGNYLRGQDAAWLGAASVAYCPRTHAFFDHPRHPFSELLRTGVRIALGTDSRASNPDLDLWSEMVFIWSRRQEYELSGDAILRMGTLSGAEALGMGSEVGTLTCGKQADFIIRPLDKAKGTPEDPHALLFENPGEPREVFLAGAPVLHGF